VSLGCARLVDTGLVAFSAARAFLCAGVLAIAAHFVLRQDTAIYDAIGLASAGLILVGTAYYRPRTWPAWIMLAASQILMAFGELVFDNLTSSYPGPADVLYLAADVTLVAALVLLAARSAKGRWSSHLDALIVAFALGIAAWPLVFSGGLDTSSPAAAAVSVAYPVADVLLLGVLVRLLFLRDRRTPAFWLLTLGVLPLFIADGAYVLPALEGTYAGGTSWLDAGWLLSYVFFAAAALHPTMGSLVESREHAREPVSLRRGLVLGGALVTAPVATVVAELSGRSFAVEPVLIALAALLILVILRFAAIVRELDGQRLRAEDSERKFRMVFERAPIGISVGRDGVMSETNPTLQRLLGYTGEELAGMHYTDVTAPDEEWLAMQNELNEGKRDRFAIDKRYVRKDGVLVDTHVHVARDLEDGFGISLIEDVTERHALEDQLRQSQKMEAIGKLAGGIAHDFNNLMTAVLGYSDLLLMAFEADDPRRSKVDAIRDSAVRASDLTRQLLAFGRRQVLQAEEVDVRGVVERMDTLLHRLIGEHIRLDTVFGSEEVIVRADRTQLEQVVMNLAVNARDAMPDGGTLTIGVLSDGESAILSVIDRGEGMDAKTVARIYEPFFTTKPVGEGSGLGLSTVHGIVGQSGGTIDVQTAPGKGTIFTIRFPLAHPAPILPEAPVPATLVD
jgi:PAS domain S-box-containing protein